MFGNFKFIPASAFIRIDQIIKGEQFVVCPDPGAPFLLSICGIGLIHNIPDSCVMVSQFLCKHTRFLRFYAHVTIECNSTVTISLNEKLKPN